MDDLVTKGLPAPMRARQAAPPDEGETGNAEDHVDQDDTQEPQLWPCNVQPARVFVAMQTQWRVGFAGRTGLDYGVLPQVMGWEQVSAGEQAQVWADVRAMEVAALGVWAEQAKRDRERQERETRSRRPTR